MLISSAAPKTGLTSVLSKESSAAYGAAKGSKPDDTSFASAHEDIFYGAAVIGAQVPSLLSQSLGVSRALPIATGAVVGGVLVFSGLQEMKKATTFSQQLSGGIHATVGAAVMAAPLVPALAEPIALTTLGVLGVKAATEHAPELAEMAVRSSLSVGQDAYRAVIGSSHQNPERDSKDFGRDVLFASGLLGSRVLDGLTDGMVPGNAVGKALGLLSGGVMAAAGFREMQEAKTTSDSLRGGAHVFVGATTVAASLLPPGLSQVATLSGLGVLAAKSLIDHKGDIASGLVGSGQHVVGRAVEYFTG